MDGISRRSVLVGGVAIASLGATATLGFFEQAGAAPITPSDIYRFVLAAGFTPDNAVTFTPLALQEMGTTSNRGLWAVSIAGQESVTGIDDPALLAALEQVQLTRAQRVKAHVAARHVELAKRTYGEIIRSLDPATVEKLRDAVKQAIAQANPCP